MSTGFLASTGAKDYPAGMKLLIVGATGLVGRNTLDLAVRDERVTSVIAPTRRPIPPREKLAAPVVDFDRLSWEEDWWKVDAVACALGTTISTAGSRPAFRKVDHDYVLDVARAAKGAGAETFVLNSAMGADPASWFFYSRVKGETERDLRELGFRSLTLVRPGLIGGEREEPRPAERVASVALRLLGPVLPRSARINPAPRIAGVMLEAALAGTPGVHVVRSSEMA